MSQCGASALSAFSPDTQHIYWNRISLLSKGKLLKQTNANVILAVTRFLDMGHNKDWFSHRPQIKTFTDFLSSDAVFNLALLGELYMRVLQVITFWRITLNHIPDHDQIDGIPSLLLQNYCYHINSASLFSCQTYCGQQWKENPHLVLEVLLFLVTWSRCKGFRNNTYNKKNNNY